jgi:ribosomal protein L40E
VARFTLKTCTYCGAENDDAASVCLRCGSDSTGRIQARRFSARTLYVDPVSRFRVIVVVGLVSYLVTVFGPWVLWRDLSNDTYDALSWGGLDAVVMLPPIVQWLTVALWVAASVGVYFFIRAARVLYTGLVGFSILTILVGGLQPLLAVESFLNYLSCMSDGAILVLAYWSPLRKRFASGLEHHGAES